MWYGNINVWKHGTIHAENVNKCQETQILALAQIAQVMSPNLYVYFYNMLRSCASCIWPVLLPDRNCFCHLSPEEFKLFSDEKVRSTVARNRAASDNQFINISNPDPFTLLKLISTKYVFPKSCSQIPIPIQFFCQPNFIEIGGAQIQQKISSWKGPKKIPLNYPKLGLWWNSMDGNFLHLKSRFSVSLVPLSLSYLYWKIQNPTPRRKIEFLTDCCFNFQFNLRGNEYINSNVHRGARWWRKKQSCQIRIPICLNWL